MGGGSRFDAARERLTAAGVQDPEPIRYLCEALAYLCRAARTDALGEPPEPPSGQWAIDAALSLPDVPYVHAEIVVRETEDDGGNVHDALAGLGAMRLDAVIG